MLNFFWKFFILKFCFGQIRVDVELCTSRSQSSGILPESQGQRESLFFRWQHEPKYKMLKSGYLYTSRSDIQSYYLKGIDLYLRKSNFSSRFSSKIDYFDIRYIHFLWKWPFLLKFDHFLIKFSIFRWNYWKIGHFSWAFIQYDYPFPKRIIQEM